MSRHTENTKEDSKNDIKYYTPDEDLVNWISKRLEIERQRRIFEIWQEKNRLNKELEKIKVELKQEKKRLKRLERISPEIKHEKKILQELEGKSREIEQEDAKLEEELTRKSTEEIPKVIDKLPDNFYEKLNESGARKTEILNNIVFQSMANLIYFFEALAISPSLNKLFEKDVKNLLDPRFTKDNVRFEEMGGDPSGSDYKRNNLFRLVSSALTIPNDKDHEQIKNFRVALLHQLQIIIRKNVKNLMYLEDSFRGQIIKSAIEDFNRAIGWTAVLAKSTSDEADKENKRQIGFLPIQVSHKQALLQLHL